MGSNNIHPVKNLLLKREDKELITGRKGRVFWFYGLSGSGKSTLAIQLEKNLHEAKVHSIVLDGDNLRSTINRDLGFNDNDRKENIRRVSEIAKTLAENGLVVIASLITPKEKFREMARSIIGNETFKDIFVQASYEKCKERDVKGLYEKVNSGEIKDFTGDKSEFEQPNAPWLLINTENESQKISGEKILEKILKEIEI